MSEAPEPATIDRAVRLRGRLAMPSDKSIAHRALIANAIAEGEAVVRLLHPGADLLSTIRCLRDLGASIEPRPAAGGWLEVSIVGGPLRTPTRHLDCGNSGTSMRLLAGVLAASAADAVLDGDAILRRRPMERLAAPLRAAGARVETTEGHAPLRVAGGSSLRALGHRLPVASAQLVGALAFAALGAEGTTVIETPGPTRDHTERLLSWMGAGVVRHGWTTMVEGPARLQAASLTVPGDPSSASAWLVAAALHPDAELELDGVGLNPTRLALIELLREMGAEIEIIESVSDGAEPMGTIRVRSASSLRPIRIDGARTAELIDELPLIGVAMAACDGMSELRDAGELRLKESDRIATVVSGLAAIGAEVTELPDGWRVRAGSARAAEIVTAGDHRVAIAFAVAALSGVAGPVRIDDPKCAAVSYPTFWRDVALVAGGAPATTAAVPR